MYGSIHVPRTVARELLAKSGPEADLLDAAFADFIATADLPSVTENAMPALKDVDAGERDAIALAILHKEPLIIDDKAGRAAARELGVAVTGTVGILLAARKLGLIPGVLSLLEQIRDRGYWFSEALLSEAARLSSESM